MKYISSATLKTAASCSIEAWSCAEPRRREPHNPQEGRPCLQEPGRPRRAHANGVVTSASTMLGHKLPRCSCAPLTSKRVVEHGRAAKCKAQLAMQGSLSLKKPARKTDWYLPPPATQGLPKCITKAMNSELLEDRASRLEWHPPQVEECRTSFRFPL